jgi:hypothetical protein
LCVSDANFRIFSETLLAGVLDPEYELAIMNYRESHRGTLLGMTRFRDGLDDMPILGYGRSSLAHDRLYSFHNTLAGHSLNCKHISNPILVSSRSVFLRACLR